MFLTPWMMSLSKQIFLALLNNLEAFNYTERDADAQKLCSEMF